MSTETYTHNRLAYLYVLPALVVMGMFIAYPFVYNVIISFSNMNLSHFREWEFNGIENYLNVLLNADFWYYFFKTVLWTVLNLVAHVSIGVFLALLLNEDIKAKTFFRTLLILPWAVPQYITAKRSSP